MCYKLRPLPQVDYLNFEGHQNYPHITTTLKTIPSNARVAAMTSHAKVCKSMQKYAKVCKSMQNTHTNIGT